MIYGNKIKELREEHMLTQEKVAEILQVHFTAYSQFEREYTIIPIDHLNTLSNYYNVSVDYLFNLTTTQTYPNSNPNININLSSTRIKEFRKEHKLTQIKLANILNTAFSTISAYERKRYPIATPYIYTICKKYHISADYLLGKINTPKYLK